MIAPYETDGLKQGFYSESGTVLRRRESSKSGQYLLLFLRGMGPVWATAPSGSGRSKFSGALEPMIWGTFELYRSPSRFFVKSAEIKEDFLPIRGDPSRLLTALRFYKVTSRAMVSEIPNDGVLNLLWSAMTLLSAGCAPDAVEFRFTWRLLRYLGLQPSLLNCVKCGGRLAGDSFLCGDGLMCQSCAASGGGAKIVPQSDLHLLEAAALLEHESFMSWAKKDTPKIFQPYVKFLMSFFVNIN